jgi:hypothetical protein
MSQGRADVENFLFGEKVVVSQKGKLNQGCRAKNACSSCQIRFAISALVVAQNAKHFQKAGDK